MARYMGLLLPFLIGCVGSDPMPGRNEERHMALQFVQTHDCHVVYRREAESRYDYATGRLKIEPGHTDYECSGVDEWILIRD
jgi:hypothetical protein